MFGINIGVYADVDARGGLNSADLESKESWQLLCLTLGGPTL